MQLSKACLEDVFRYILVRNTVPLDPGRLRRSWLDFSGAATAIDATELFYDEVIENIQDVSNRGICFDGDMSSLDLIHPEAVIDLREIADQMIRSGYEMECCQVYCSVRRDVLDKLLVILGTEKLSIGEVQMMKWLSLDDKIRRWIPAFRLVVRGLFSNERRLCDQIFTGYDSIKEVCFLETCKGCVMQFLDFGEAVTIGTRSTERLFAILDMYQALSAVIPDLQALFMDGDAGDMVCTEAKEVLDALGVAAIGNFVEFENAVQGEASRKPMQNNGEIHPFTRYVMNYTKLLVDYSDTLNSLLETVEDNSGLEKEKNDNSETSMSLIAQRLLALITSLESNLEEKSRMYEDGAMQYIFLMNNILYIVEKVKDSELRNALGDNWIKKRRGLIRQHATHYLRAAWTKVLSCLKDEGISGSSSAAKVALKERFKNFNICFEDIYRIQTAWKVPDPQLREDLRISISVKVIPAYRSFLGRFRSHIESERHAWKYIKYSPEDLENCLLDLFEGTPLILQHINRKST